MKTREEMLAALSESVCNVKFTKVNGDFRDMTCTRNLERIPETARPKTQSEVIGKNIPVYDLNANGWRSFVVENVKEFSVDR